MKLKANNSFILFFIFLCASGCQSKASLAKKDISDPAKSQITIPFVQAQPSGSIKKILPIALVLYASDTPNEFTYFTTFFTHKLKKEGLFHAIHKHELNDFWISDAQNKNENSALEQKIRQIKDEFKFDYKNNSMEKIAHSYEENKEFLFNLMENKSVAIKRHVLAEYYFWSAVVELKLKLKKTPSLYYYQKLSSLSEKNVFELDLDKPTLKLIQTTLPIKETESHIIKKFKIKINSQLNKMPQESLELKRKVLQEQANYLILIFWSKHLNSLEIKLFNAQNFSLLKKTQFKVNSQIEFEALSQKIITFLR